MNFTAGQQQFSCCLIGEAVRGSGQACEMVLTRWQLAAIAPRVNYDIISSMYEHKDRQTIAMRARALNIGY